MPRPPMARLGKKRGAADTCGKLCATHALPSEGFNLNGINWLVPSELCVNAWRCACPGAGVVLLMQLKVGDLWS